MTSMTRPTRQERHDKRREKRGWLDRLRARGSMATAILWRGASYWVAGLVVALFPLLFVLDENTDASFSPVLPGILALALLWAVGPFIVVEALHRKWRSIDEGRQAAKVNKLLLGGKRFLLLASIWFVSWLALGA